MAQIHWLTAVEGLSTSASNWTGDVIRGASDSAIPNAAGGPCTVTANATQAVPGVRVGAQIHWLSAVDGLFTDAADWTGGVVPGPSDDAILDAVGGAFTVTANAAEAVNSVQLAANATLAIGAQFTASVGTWTGANAGTIAVGDGGALTLGGTLDNTGLIALSAENTVAKLVIDVASSLTGGGTVTLAEVNADTCGIYLTDGAKLTNLNDTISGAGSVNVSVNKARGIIDATSGQNTLYATVGVNQGLMESSNGATLILRGTVNNVGGVILAGAGSTVEINRATIEGGTLSGSGEIIGYDGTINGATSQVTNEGTLSVNHYHPSGFDLTILGSIVNGGVIHVGGNSVLYCSAPTTLSGGGTLMLSGTVEGVSLNATLTNVNNTIFGRYSGTLGGVNTVLINEAGGVIDGSGMRLEASGAVMINAGLIEATGSHVGGGRYNYSLNVYNTTIDNTGTILIGVDSKLELIGADIQGGAIEASVGSACEIYGAGDVLDGTTNAIDNQATISISYAGTLTLAGAIVNSGSVGLTEDATLVVGTPGVTLSGGGTVSLGNAKSYIKGPSATATLTNADNIIEGEGQLGDGAMGLVNETGGTIAATTSTALVINLGANTLVNAGLIESLGVVGQGVIAGPVANTGTLEAAGGTLTVDGAVTGSGQAVITAGTLAFASSFDEAVAFTGTGGELQLAQSQAFNNSITGFSASGATSLDLRDIGFVGSGEATFSGTVSGGILTVTDGTHTAHISLAGDFLGDTFTASSDGNGGTSVLATGGGGDPTQLHWLNPVNDLFTNASDWTGDLVPAAADDAILDAAGGAFTVTASVAEAVDSVQLAANATLAVGAQFTASAGTGTGANAGTIAIGDGGTLTVGGTLYNTGLIALNAENAKAKLIIDAARVSLVGSGTITLAGLNSYYGSGIYLRKGASLINVNNTISGAGNITVSINKAKGVIDATRNQGDYDLYAAVGINNGLMEATSGGNLDLEGTINNAGGVILAGAASQAVLDHATIEGGTLAGPGSFLDFGGTLDGQYSPVTNAGTITVEGFSYFYLLGTIANNGVIQMRGADTLTTSGATTLTGGGTVLVSGDRNTWKNVGSLTNVSNTIAGYGTLASYGTIVNEAGGVIDGDGMRLFLSSSGAGMTNAGLIEASSYYGLVIGGGTIDNTGVILAGSGSKLTLEYVQLDGGTLESSKMGTIVLGASVVLDGTLSTIDNQATLDIGSVQATIQGAVVNSGMIAMGHATKHGSYPTLLVGAAGLTLSGGGTVRLGYAADIVKGVSGMATLTNVGNILQGGGQLGDGEMGLVNETGGTIEADIASALVINLGADTLANGGIIETAKNAQAVIDGAVANTGTLYAGVGQLNVEGAVTGSGEAAISGGTLTFASSFNEAVTFAGSGELQLAQSQTFTNTITGFSASGATSLDLRDIGFVGASEATFSGTMSGGTLTVTDGTHTAHLSLDGDYLGDTFTAASDKSGGTSVTAQGPMDAQVSPLAFVSAMARFGGSAMSGYRVGEAWWGRETMIYAPRAAMA